MRYDKYYNSSSIIIGKKYLAPKRTLIKQDK